jgi:hypothetical protein
MIVILIRAMSVQCMPIATMKRAYVVPDIVEMEKRVKKTIRVKIVINTQRAKTPDIVESNVSVIQDTKETESRVKRQQVHVITVMIMPHVKLKVIHQFPSAFVTLATKAMDFIVTKIIHVKTVLPTPNARKVNAFVKAPVIGGMDTNALIKMNVTIQPITTVINTLHVPTIMEDTPVNVIRGIPAMELHVTKTLIHVTYAISMQTAWSHIMVGPANAKMDILEMMWTTTSAIVTEKLK